MSKSWLNTLFGLGNMPAKVRQELEPEGLVLFDEGVGRVARRATSEM